MIAIIDGDILVYQCAFAAQFSVYKELDASGQETGFAYRKKSQAPKDSHTVPMTVFEDAQKATDALDSAMAAIIRATKADEILVFLTEGECFRHRLTDDYPDDLKYKGNRKSEKPRYYQLMREILSQKYSAIRVKDYEADDAMSIMHVNYNERKIESVICTIDKDLLNTPGRHYNPNSGTFSDISPKVAVKAYMLQILTGDVADNIKGIKGVGPKKGLKILDIAGDDTKKWGSLVKDAYREAFPDDWEKRFTLSRKLLYILQRPQKDLTIEMLDQPVLVQGIDLPVNTTSSKSAGNFTSV